MSIKSEIERLGIAKSSLKTAIEGKGVAVPEGTKLDGYSGLVEQISAGGSVSSLPTITGQDSGKQLYARNSEWVVEEPPCGILGEEVLFDKEVDTSSGIYVDPNTKFNIHAGFNYVITINEDEHSTIAKEIQTIPYLGNMALLPDAGDEAEDTGEDYFIVFLEDFFVFASRVLGTYKLKISSKKIKKIDNIYIESPIIPGAALNSQIFNYSENIASGDYSHAEGFHTTASGDYSHAECHSTTASGNFSHAEGSSTTASGDYSHAEGFHTTASGYASHAEGFHTTASGDYSHAEGNNTIASGKYSHVEGQYNIEDIRKYCHIVGNGRNPENRSNAHTLDWDGNTWYAGELYLGGTGQDDPEAWKASLPKYTASDEGKILKIVNGVPTWSLE